MAHYSEIFFYINEYTLENNLRFWRFKVLALRTRYIFNVLNNKALKLLN